MVLKRPVFMQKIKYRWNYLTNCWFFAFCHFQGLWATPKYQIILFKRNNVEGWDLRKLWFLKNHHFKTHPKGYTRVSVFGLAKWNNNWCEIVCTLLSSVQMEVSWRRTQNICIHMFIIWKKYILFKKMY